MSFDPEEILGAALSAIDPARFLVAADDFLARGMPRVAASALDRAYGLLPRDEGVQRQRRAVLDELAITEHGLVFRYVPAGIFLMGSTRGDPDERPVHPVRLGDYWVAQVPTTWAAYCELLGWAPPPHGSPPESHVWPTESDEAEVDTDTPFLLREANKIRRQYCETETTRAFDHHAHDPNLVVTQGSRTVSVADAFGSVPRANPARPYAYDRKPMVGVRRREPRYLVERLCTERVTYALPTEAEWEKAARGGLMGCTWSWGDEPPTPARCDFDRYGDFRLTDPYDVAPNGYGIHAMCGGVWEWTSSWYDALAYHQRAAAGIAARDPIDERPDTAEGPSYVVRGGSWSDCAAAVTTSFRMARSATGLRASSPNVGFRLIRKERGFLGPAV